MATLEVYKVDLDGGEPTFTSASVGGDEFVNSGRAMLIVKNGGTGSITVTVDSQRPCNYGFDHDVQQIVESGGEVWLGPFSAGRFNDADEKVQISYSDVTSVTVAVVEVS